MTMLATSAGQDLTLDIDQPETFTRPRGAAPRALKDTYVSLPTDSPGGTVPRYAGLNGTGHDTNNHDLSTNNSNAGYAHVPTDSPGGKNQWNLSKSGTPDEPVTDMIQGSSVQWNISDRYTSLPTVSPRAVSTLATRAEPQSPPVTPPPGSHGVTNFVEQIYAEFKHDDDSSTDDDDHEELALWHAGNESKPLAPPLNDNLQFHVFFLYQHNDRDWALNVMDKLEAPPLCFHCCCHDRDFDVNESLQGSTHLGMKNAQKTVMVLTPDFITDVWCHADLQLLSEMDILLVQKDLILVLLQDCDIPHVLSDVVCVDVSTEDWWGKLLANLITSEETPMTEETALSLSSSLIGLNPNLKSGHLLHSSKSRCRCCGKEVVDPTELPDELIAHGIQIPADEYREAICHLMTDAKFRCHVWCYNVPAAMLFFTLLLALCLAIIPLIEAKLIFHAYETGLEFVHAGIVWLCFLTLYMVVMQISKRQMKGNTYKRLTFVNAILIKYNMLAGVENLGLADCNKYYLHFFYFEIGPCLAYLQELMVNIEEYSACFRNQIAESGDVTIDMSCEESITNSNDTSRVLDNITMTNTSIQSQAEDLILQHSGEYISMLITKRLGHPRRQRHVRDYPCLCQFVEQRVYKMIV